MSCPRTQHSAPGGLSPDCNLYFTMLVTQTPSCMCNFFFLRKQLKPNRKVNGFSFWKVNWILFIFLKILNIGKSINFIRRVCQDRSPIRGGDEMALDYSRSQEASGTCTVYCKSDLNLISLHFIKWIHVPVDWWWECWTV